MVEQFRPQVGDAEGRTLPAPKVVAVVALALVIAMLLNSGAMLRAGEGMHDGLTRSAVLAVARPVDSFARAVRLDAPRRALDSAFGHERKTAEDGEGGLTQAAGGLDLPPATLPPATLPPATLPPAVAVTPTPAPTSPATPEPTPSSPLRTPTRAEPLRVLVTGDSLVTYIGAQITNLAQPEGLLAVSVKSFNGTGLTRPSFFDWNINAKQEMARRDPEIVVVVLGGNDGWNLEIDGRGYGANTQQWEDEYARRVAAVMTTMTGGGQRQVYWSAPPIARSQKWARIFARQNRAVARAAAAVPGAHYVDLFHPSAVHGKFAEELVVDGRKVRARQADGIHFTYEGSVLPARLLLAAMNATLGKVA